MSNRFFWMAFAIGLAAIGWVGIGFVNAHWIAFAMTLAIAGAYLTGAAELRRHRGETGALARVLAGEAVVPSPDNGAAASGAAAMPATLHDWLQNVPATLRGAVRQRVEEGRGALPGPVLTPYLVGLLVMLGMLGTFLGMVVTFKGAVFALEGSTDLQAIRAALAEPIRGLGLSFGTSVAGVAGSAALGLMSVIARRERQGVARLLDARCATLFRPFSRAHQREQALQAAQAQAGVLPAVVERLDAMMQRMEQRSESLDGRLLAAQAQFHRDANAAYATLASEMGASLQKTVADASRGAGEAITPLIADAMSGMAQQQARIEAERLQAWSAQLQSMAVAMQHRLDEAAREADARNEAVLAQVGGLLAQSDALVQARAASEARWLAEEAHRSEQIANVLRTQLDALRAEESRRGDAAVERLGELHAAATRQLETLRAEESRRGDAAAERFRDLHTELARQLATLRSDESQRVDAAAERFTALHADLAQQLATLRAEESSRVEASGERLRDMHAELAQQLATLRAEEGQRADAGAQRLASLHATLAQQLDALRGDEARRADAALARFGELHAAVAQQLEALRTAEGHRLDAAVDRFGALHAAVTQQLEALRTEEVRRLDLVVARFGELHAAVTQQLDTLRGEESRRGEAAVERLGELHAAVAEQLATLGNALEAPLTRLLATASEVPQAAAGVLTQLRAEMGRLAAQENVTLQERTVLVERLGQLVQTVEAASRQAGDMAALAGANAVELGAWGDAFGQGVQQFHASNDKLIAALQQVEAAIGKSSARSDEQLAYYVAQAREVIDLSIASQHGVVDKLRELAGKPAGLGVKG